jgi:hypothetical protein
MAAMRRRERDSPRIGLADNQDPDALYSTCASRANQSAARGEACGQTTNSMRPSKSDRAKNTALPANDNILPCAEPAPATRLAACTQTMFPAAGLVPIHWPCCAHARLF